MGRPTGYNTNEVLKEAARLFRFRGFRAVSVQDLVDATGLSRFAIYEKFGNKEGVFHAALRFYLEGPVKRELLKPFNAEGAGLDELTQLLTFMRDANQNPELPPGCLITNASVELGGTDECVEEVGQAFCDVLQQAIERALVNAEAQGHLLAGRHAAERAEYVVTMINAFMVLSTVSRSSANKLIGAVIAEVTSWRQTLPFVAVPA